MTFHAEDEMRSSDGPGPPGREAPESGSPDTPTDGEEPPSFLEEIFRGDGERPDPIRPGGDG